MSVSEPFHLLPGLRLVRRDADHLQLGVDPPRRAVLRDLPEVRRLVGDLAVGNRPARPGPEAGRALAAIIDAGLLVPDDAPRRRERVARARLRVDAAADVASGVTALLEAAGVRARRGRCTPDAVLLVRDGEVAARAGSTRWSATRSRTSWSATTVTRSWSGRSSPRGAPPACAASTATSASRTRGAGWRSSRRPPSRRW